MTDYNSNAKHILANKDSYIGHIVVMQTPFAGTQWVLLRDVEQQPDGNIKFTFKMICHNHHLGIRSLSVQPDQTIVNQRIEDFTKWCNMYNIEMNLYNKVEK